MKHQVELPADEEKFLAELAKRNGVSPHEALHGLLQLSLSLKAGLPGGRVSKASDVMGGDACLANTRVPIWSLVEYKRQGLSDTRILEIFPILTPADLNTAWEYYAAYSREVDAEQRRHEEAA